MFFRIHNGYPLILLSYNVSNVAKQTLLLFVVPLLSIMALMPVIVGIVGMENFEGLLLSRNPFALGLISAFIISVLFLFSKLILYFKQIAQDS